MTATRFEIWERPGVGTFQRKFPLGFVEGFSLGLGIFGRGELRVPRDHPRLDDILFVDPTNHANDKGSLIRAFQGEKWLYDFYASRMEINFGDLGSRTAKITGTGLGHAMEITRLRQFDWDRTPSTDPDWPYGTGENLPGNPAFEKSADYNPRLNGGEFDISIGFEDENSSGWAGHPGSGIFQPVFIDPTVDNGDARTGTFSLVWTPDSLAGKTQTLSAISKKIRIAGSERYQFTVYVKSAAGTRFIFGVSNVVTAHHTNGFIDNGVGWAELGNVAEGTGSTDGTWQQVDLDVTFDVFINYADVTMYVAYTDTAAGPIVRIDDWSGAGFNLGMYSWEPTSFAIVTLFDRDITPPIAASEGAGTANVTTTAANHGIGYPQSVVVNRTHTFSMDIYHATGSAQSFTVRIVRTAGGTVIGSTTASVPTGGASWTTLAVTAEIDVEDVFIQVLKVTSGTWWMDNGKFYEGFEAQTVGEILSDIIDDAAVDHIAQSRSALDWLVENYSDTLDSDSVAWNEDVSIRLKRGSSYRLIIEALEPLGYEFDFVPDPADDSVLEFSAYNPNGLGSDLTTGDGLAVVNGFVALGPLVRREPAATYLMVEGDELEWADDRDTGLETAWGEIEDYIGSKDQMIDNLGTQATQELNLDGLEGIRFTLQGSTLTPGIDYKIGDIVRITPGVIASARYRVFDITVQGSDPEDIFQVSAEQV